MSAKGPRRRPRSRNSTHKRALRAAAKEARKQMPPASDVEVYDANGNLLRVERSKKPLD